MKIVALLSGGKDSCYNIIHCAQNGHQLVAAASLGPGPGKEEIDSYMYQTVGQDAIELVAQALDVPLYRRVISGSALEQGTEYGARDGVASSSRKLPSQGVAGDETEDMYELLKLVKENHPEIEGVSVGAILSNYQRVRVEHVCKRLSLTAFAYLWQRDQTDLMREMVQAGMEAVLIKIAGIGLKKEHLGLSLAKMEPTLLQLNYFYGLHVCGEGGEYETLTLDCPAFHKKIILDEVEPAIHSEVHFAELAHLRIKQAHLEDKTPGFEFAAATIPPLLDEDGERIRDVALQVHAKPTPTSNVIIRSNSKENPPTSTRRIGPWLSISNIYRVLPDGKSLSIEAESIACFETIRDTLASHSMHLSQICHINVYLSDMTYFSSLNAVMSTLFGTSPPTRACVAVDLPEPYHILIDVIAYDTGSQPRDRQALHVQSVSYWAPANIGPYSQSILVGERVFVSGQIGLLPSQMIIPAPRSTGLETALALQHAKRITEAFATTTGGNWKEVVQGAILWIANAGDLDIVRAAWAAYLEIREEKPAPACVFVVLKSLPRNSAVEVQIVSHTGRELDTDDSDSDDDKLPVYPNPSAATGDLSQFGCRVHWETSESPDENAFCSIFFDGADVKCAAEYLKAQPDLSRYWTGTLSTRMFHTTRAEEETVSEICELLFENPCITYIPARLLANADRSDWGIVFCLIGA